jgi:4-hydroxy-3-methylbut-2-enyl diphosphate reductase
MGAPNSSNSRRLVEVASRGGCKRSWLIERAQNIPFDEFENVKTIGLSAGASAPEVLVDEAIAAVKARYEACIEIVTTAEENVSFGLPRELRPEG